MGGQSPDASGLWRGSVPMCRDRFKSLVLGWGKKGGRQFFRTLLEAIARIGLVFPS